MQSPWKLFRGILLGGFPAHIGCPYLLTQKTHDRIYTPPEPRGTQSPEYSVYPAIECYCGPHRCRQKLHFASHFLGGPPRKPGVQDHSRGVYAPCGHQNSPGKRGQVQIDRRLRLQGRRPDIPGVCPEPAQGSGGHSPAYRHQHPATARRPLSPGTNAGETGRGHQFGCRPQQH